MMNSNPDSIPNWFQQPLRSSLMFSMLATHLMLTLKKAEFIQSVYDLSKFKGQALPEIAFAGRSNVGKSSMLNRLMNRKNLAKTSSTPGKTQSVNYFKIDNSCYFVDLPGFGYAKVSKSMRAEWGALMEAYFETNEYLRGVIHLVDSRHKPTALDLQMNQILNQRGIVYMIVLTKADKLSNNQLAQSVKRASHEFGLPEGLYPIPFSALTGLGKKQVINWINWRITEN
jgi:GTP-binding protein